MSILSSIADLATGGILGTITGLAGSGLQLLGQSKKNSHEIEQKKLDIEQIKIEADEERKMIALENEFKDRTNTRDFESKVIANDTDLLKTSIKSDRSTYSNGAAAALERLGEHSAFAAILGTLALGLLILVDFVRGILRPVACAYVLYEVCQLKGELATQTLTYLSTMMVAFYFGSRALGKSLK